ncbi:MAG: SRPBCC family protein [Myxococcota bacterium]
MRPARRRAGDWERSEKSRGVERAALVGAWLIGLVAAAAAGAGTLRLDVPVNAPVEEVWSAVRDFQAVHRRLAQGFVVDTEPVAGAAVETRRVTFANGAVAEEVLLGLDEGLRRLAYSSIRGRALHHAASMEVVPAPEGSRIVWTTDVLPDDLVPGIRAMMEQGAAAMQRTLVAEQDAAAGEGQGR